MALHLVCVKAQVPDGQPQVTQPPCPEGYFVTTVEMPDPIPMTGAEFAQVASGTAAALLTIHIVARGFGLIFNMVGRM